jgi:hypothetical protein
MARGRPEPGEDLAADFLTFSYAAIGSLHTVSGRADGSTWEVTYHWDEECRLAAVESEGRELRVSHPDETTVVLADERGSQRFTLDAAGSRLLAYERTQIDRVERLAWELVYEPDRVWVRPTAPSLEHLRAESFYEHGRIVRFEVDLDGDGALESFAHYHWGADGLAGVTTPAGRWSLEGEGIWTSMEAGVRPCGT